MLPGYGFCLYRTKACETFHFCFVLFLRYEVGIVQQLALINFILQFFCILRLAFQLFFAGMAKLTAFVYAAYAGGNIGRIGSATAALPATGIQCIRNILLSA